MPKVKMTQTVVGIGMHRAADQVYELPDHEAQQYVDAKIAVHQEDESDAAAHTPAEKRDKAVKKNFETR